MAQSGYSPGVARSWWWKVAKHLDDTARAATSATAYNLDDVPLVLEFCDTVRQAQAKLFEIFQAKGLLSGAVNGTSAGAGPKTLSPLPSLSMPSPMVPSSMPSSMVPPQAMPANGLSAAEGIPFTFGAPFGTGGSPMPPPPFGWPSVATPPPPPPPPPGQEHPLDEGAAVVAPAAVDYSGDAFDYGTDMGQGFEQQKPGAIALEEAEGG